MVAAQQVASLLAAIAGVVVGSPAAPSRLLLQLLRLLVALFALRRGQQGLDFLQPWVRGQVRARERNKTEN